MDSQYNNDLRAFLQDFRRTIELTSARLLEIPEGQSQFSKREGKWSPKEIIGHYRRRSNTSCATTWHI